MQFVDDLACTNACGCCRCSSYSRLPEALACRHNCTLCCCHESVKAACVQPTALLKSSCQMCCCDCRAAIPGDAEVPCALALLGLRCCGSAGELPPGSEPHRVNPADLRLTSSLLCLHASLYCNCAECIGADWSAAVLCAEWRCSQKIANGPCTCLKTVNQCLCVDCRCALPADPEVPCACALCGHFCAGRAAAPPRPESLPILGGIRQQQGGAYGAVAGSYPQAALAPEAQQMARSVGNPMAMAVAPAPPLAQPVVVCTVCGATSDAGAAFCATCGMEHAPQNPAALRKAMMDDL